MQWCFQRAGCLARGLAFQLAHESLPTLDDDETCTESYYHKQFIGRQVHLVDMCPGIVTQYKARQGGFVVKYYKDSLPEPKERKRCKIKLEIVGKRALLPLLLCTVNRDETGNEDNCQHHVAI